MTDSDDASAPVLPALVRGEHWGWQNGNSLGDTDIFGQSQLPQHCVTAAEQPLRSVLLAHQPEGRLCPLLLLSQQCDTAPEGIASRFRSYLLLRH